MFCLLRYSTSRLCSSPSRILYLYFHGGYAEEDLVLVKHVFSHASTDSSFTIFYVNIQRLNNPFKLAKIQHHIHKHNPDMIGITETWLGPGIPDPRLDGYEVIARLDKQSGMTFAPPSYWHIFI